MKTLILNEDFNYLIVQSLIVFIIYFIYVFCNFLILFHKYTIIFNHILLSTLCCSLSTLWPLCTLLISKQSVLLRLHSVSLTTRLLEVMSYDIYLNDNYRVALLKMLSNPFRYWTRIYKWDNYEVSLVPEIIYLQMYSFHGGICIQKNIALITVLAGEQCSRCISINGTIFTNIILEIGTYAQINCMQCN